MTKKLILVVIVLIIIAVIVGIYWNYQKTTVPPETPETPKTPEGPTVDVSSFESETDAELDGLLNDLKDMEELDKDTSLDNLDSSLSTLAE